MRTIHSCRPRLKPVIRTTIIKGEIVRVTSIEDVNHCPVERDEFAILRECLDMLWILGLLFLLITCLLLIILVRKRNVSKSILDGKDIHPATILGVEQWPQPGV